MMDLNGHAVQGLMTTMNTMIATGANTMAVTEPVPRPDNPRTKMTDIPVFFGGKGKHHERQTEYILWKEKLDAKLIIDHQLYQTKTDRLTYTISQLEDNAYVLIDNSIKNMSQPDSRFP